MIVWHIVGVLNVSFFLPFSAFPFRGREGCSNVVKTEEGSGSLQDAGLCY